MKRTGYDLSAYDYGVSGNVRAVLGDNAWLWLLPCSPPSGDGLTYMTEEAPLRLSADMEAGRGVRRKTHQSSMSPLPKSGGGAGTGECGDSGPESGTEDAASEDQSKTPMNAASPFTAPYGGAIRR